MGEAMMVVERWHAALNAGDADAAVALVSPAVEVGGPRGVARGADVLRDWIDHAGITMAPVSWWARGDSVVVEQMASWRDEDGQPGDPVRVFSSFAVANGRITRILRFDSREIALRTSGLTEEDQVPEDASPGR